jgi:hypothetical protein
VSACVRDAIAANALRAARDRSTCVKAKVEIPIGRNANPSPPGVCHGRCRQEVAGSAYPTITHMLELPNAVASSILAVLAV